MISKQTINVKSKEIIKLYKTKIDYTFTLKSKTYKDLTDKTKFKYYNFKMSMLLCLLVCIII